MAVAVLSPEEYGFLSRYGSYNNFVGMKSGTLYEAHRTYELEELYEMGLSDEDIEMALGMGDLFTMQDSWWDGGFECDVTHTTTPGGEDIVVVEY